MTRPTIHLFADVLGGFGGIETYLDALSRKLAADGWPVRVAVSLNGPAPFLADLEALGIPVHVQRRVPGDRWHVRQRLLVRHVVRQARPGDWIYCVRQPMAEVYLRLVRAAHRKGVRVAASWMFAPEFLPPPDGASGADFRAAVAETDAVISVSECTREQFRSVYGYEGAVAVVRYHNREFFSEPVALPPGPPYNIGYLGRIDIHQKNLDSIIAAFRILDARRGDVRLNLHGGGSDIGRVQAMIEAAGLHDRIVLHGPYDHRRDLPAIVARNHVFVHTSRFEGGPCFSLLELLQAGRFVIASPVGGIPDIYAGRPHIGLLVGPESPERIAAALDQAVSHIARGGVDQRAMREIYESEFSEATAHRQWLRALGLSETSRVPAAA